MTKVTNDVAAETDAALDTPSTLRGPMRRNLLRGIAGAAIAGGAALAGCSEGIDSPLANTPTPTPTGTSTPTLPSSPDILPVTDVDMMVMMAQFHYLQAEFYSRAVLGEPLAPSLVGGAGTPGDVSGPRAVTITDAVLGQVLREIAAEKIDQVVRLRAVLGSAMPARPALNLAVDATGSFTKYGIDSVPAPAAGATAAPPTITDVYANQDALLLGAFILEDPVMMAWRGASTLMTSAANIEIAAGLMATSATHTGIIRSLLFARGNPTGAPLPSNVSVTPVHQATIRLSDLRDTYAPVEDDRGVSNGFESGNRRVIADIVPGDGDGEVYGRLPDLSINVFYMTRASVTSGGFFPAGLNGVLRKSTAN